MKKYSKKKGCGKCQTLGLLTTPIDMIKNSFSSIKSYNQANIDLFNKLTGGDPEAKYPLILDLHLRDENGEKQNSVSKKDEEGKHLGYQTISKEFIYPYSCKFNVPCKNGNEYGLTIKDDGIDEGINCETKCNTCWIKKFYNCCDINLKGSKKNVYCKHEYCGEGESKSISGVFYFNLVEIVRQIMAVQNCYKGKEGKSLLWNPITQRPFNAAEIKLLFDAYLTALKTINDKTDEDKKPWIVRHGPKIAASLGIAAMVLDYMKKSNCNGNVCEINENYQIAEEMSSVASYLFSMTISAYYAATSVQQAYKNIQKGDYYNALMQVLKSVLSIEFGILYASSAGIIKSSGIFGLSSLVNNFVTYNPEFWKGKEDVSFQIFKNKIGLEQINKIKNLFVTIGKNIHMYILDPGKGVGNRKYIWDLLLKKTEREIFLSNFKKLKEGDKNLTDDYKEKINQIIELRKNNIKSLDLTDDEKQNLKDDYKEKINQIAEVIQIMKGIDLTDDEKQELIQNEKQEDRYEKLKIKIGEEQVKKIESLFFAIGNIIGTNITHKSFLDLILQKEENITETDLDPILEKIILEEEEQKKQKKIAEENNEEEKQKTQKKIAEENNEEEEQKKQKKIAELNTKIIELRKIIKSLDLTEGEKQDLVLLNNDAINFEIHKLLISGNYPTAVLRNLVERGKIKKNDFNNNEDNFSFINIELNNAICIEEEYRRRIIPTFFDNLESMNLISDIKSLCKTPEYLSETKGGENNKINKKKKSHKKFNKKLYKIINYHSAKKHRKSENRKYKKSSKSKI